MKKQSIFLIALIVVLAIVSSMVLLVACEDIDPTDLFPTDDTTPDGGGGSGGGGGESTPWHETSAAAMQNFMDKIGDANYVITAKIDGKETLKTSVASEDVVTFKYNRDNTEMSGHADYAVMDLSGEIFQATLTNTGIDNLTYLDQGTAVDAARLQLPVIWMDDNNIWDYFTNDSEENPLHFVSSSDTIKQSIAYFAVIGSSAATTIDDVEMVFDKKKVTTATLTATYRPAIVDKINIVISITFGNAQSDERVDAWLDDADREMPDGYTAWEGIFATAISSVLMINDPNEGVPFYTGLSYATTVNGNSFIEEDFVVIHDYHATGASFADYVWKLNELGYERLVDDDGFATYRKELRHLEDDDTLKCYAAISLDYSDGAEISICKSYSSHDIDNLTDLSDAVYLKGFPELQESSNITSCFALDCRYEQIEGYLYLFDYKLVYDVYMTYDDAELAQAYVDAYIATLTDPAGFELQQASSVADELQGFIQDDDADIWVKEDTLGKNTFAYFIDTESSMIRMLFKKEAYLSTYEASSAISIYGYPSYSDGGCYDDNVTSCKDITKFSKMTKGVEADKVYQVTMSFDTEEHGSDFMDYYYNQLKDSWDNLHDDGRFLDKALAYSYTDSGTVKNIVLVDYRGTFISLEFRCHCLDE